MMLFSYNWKRRNNRGIERKNSFDFNHSESLLILQCQKSLFKILTIFTIPIFPQKQNVKLNSPIT